MKTQQSATDGRLMPPLRSPTLTREKDMKIHWHFDDEEWDPYTLLGEITIIGDYETSIRDGCTILDRWMVGLSEGLKSLSKGISAEVDLVDEPDPLFFVAGDKTYEIHYKKMEITFTDIAQATKALNAEIYKFIQELLLHPEPRDEYVINELRDILKGENNG